MQGQGRKSTSVDVYIGGRIRARRKALGVSQEQLARSLGIAFQQVQKYEHGANRVSASKLYDVAKILDVPISFFFDGLAVVDHLAPDPREKGLRVFLESEEGRALAEAFPRIPEAHLRRQVLELVRGVVRSGA